MRSRFDEQLALLNKEMIEMGALCEEVIALASKALTEADPELAQRVAPLDAEIDQKERNIESLCLKLLLQQQPGTFLYINPHVPVPSAYPKGQSPFQWSRRQ